MTAVRGVERTTWLMLVVAQVVVPQVLTGRADRAGSRATQAVAVEAAVQMAELLDRTDRQLSAAQAVTGR